MSVLAWARIFMTAWVIAWPLAVAYLLRVFGRDQRLCLLVLPVSCSGLLLDGLVDYAAAVPLVILGLALFARNLEHPRATSLATLALVACLTVLAHAVAGVILCGFLLIACVASWRRPRSLVGPVLFMVPALALLLPWLEQATDGLRLGELLGLSTRDEDGRNFLAVSRGPAVTLAMTANVLLAAGWSARNKRQALAGRLGQALLAVSVLGFFLLPLNLPGWALVSVRMVPFIWAFALLAIPRAKSPLPLWLLAPALVTAAVSSANLSSDVREFNQHDLSGLSACIDEIPPGLRVLCLVPPAQRSHSMNYLADYYQVRRGGAAQSSMSFSARDYGCFLLWVRPRKILPAPPAGDSSLFSWKDHGCHYDRLLVMLDSPPSNRPPSALAGCPPGSVEEICRNGCWAVFQVKQAVGPESSSTSRPE